MTIKRNAKRKAVTEGESIPRREGNLSPGRVPMLDEANEMARRYEAARRVPWLASSDEYKAIVERLEAARPVAAARKPENPREARAWLHTIAEHIRAKLEEYGAHKPPGPAVGPRYAQWLSDVRRLRWFADAVKAYGSEKNKKSLEQILGLKAGRGRPVVQEERNKILRKLVEILLLREPRGPTRKAQQGKPARPPWKAVGRALDMSPQAARKLYERELPNINEALAKEIAARLKQKPPPVGTAKARSAATGKEISARNRRAHEAKVVADRRAKSPRPVKSAK